VTQSESIKERLLGRKGDIWFHIEAKKYLRVWSGCPENGGKHKPITTILFRIEQQSQFSVPIHHGINYLNKDHSWINKIMELGGFYVPIEKVDEVVAILDKQKEVKDNFYW